MTDRCLDDLELEAIVAGDASLERLTAAHAHAVGCATCGAALAAIGRVRGAAAELELRSSSRDATAADPVAISGLVTAFSGTRIGRFVVQRELGRGGMGVVYAAQDETLRRTVAIKLLNRNHAKGSEAILREARAMARVSHANVVSVHEVSVVDHQVYLVMDLVDGPDLARWLRTRERGWADVLRLHVEAGRGLSAIHGAGLVHRDFKPHNVLVGADGRARVTDFGVVEWLGDPTSSRDLGLVGDEGQRATQHEVGGTPRYMAPEQLSGGKVTAAADQFSFCVSLYEGLTGVPPFGPGHVDERMASIAAGEITAPPPRCLVPRRVLAVARRGLEMEPSARFATMEELVDALQAAVIRRRRVARTVVAGVVLAGSLSVGFGLADVVDETPCAAQAEDLRGVWDSARREALGVAVEPWRSGAEAEPRLVQAVDAYAEQWRGARRAACEASVVRHEVSDDLFDSMMQCLDTRRAALQATVDLLSSRPADTATSGRRLILGLPSPLACTERERLGGQSKMPPPGQQRDAIVAAERTIAQVRALAEVGLLADARAAFDEQRPALEAIEWSPVAAKVMAVDAFIAMARGRIEAGLSAWQRAYALALDHSSADARFWIALEGVDHYIEAGQPDVAAFVLSQAQAQVAELEQPRWDATIAVQRSRLIFRRGDGLAEAESQLRTAIDLTEGSVHEADLYATACKNLSTVLYMTGRVEDAVRWLDRAIDSSAELYGRAHPSTLAWRIDAAGLLGELDRVPQAKAILAEIVHAQPRGAVLAEALGALARTHRGLGQYRPALLADERALQRYRELLPDEDRRIRQAMGAVGLDLIELGRPEAAVDVLRPAADAASWDLRVGGVAAPGIRSRLARALADAGEVPEAVAIIEAIERRVQQESLAEANGRRLIEPWLNAALVYEHAARYEPMLVAAQRAHDLSVEHGLSGRQRGTIDTLLQHARDELAPGAR